MIKNSFRILGNAWHALSDYAGWCSFLLRRVSEKSIVENEIIVVSIFNDKKSFGKVLLNE